MVGSNKNKIKNQWPDALALLTGFLQAGYDLPEALKLMCSEAPEPLHQELKRRISRVPTEAPMKDRIETLFRGKDLVYPRAALHLSLQTGAKSMSLLRTGVNLLRKKQEYHEKVKSLTAQGKWTAWIVGLSPIAFLFFMSALTPEMFSHLIQSKEGWILLGVVVAMVCVGLVFVHWLANVEA